MKIGKILSKHLKNVMKLVSSMTQEAIFRFDEDGMLIKTSDDGRTCMLYVELGEKSFVEFGDVELAIGLEPKLILKLLDVIPDDEAIDLEFNKKRTKFIIKSGKTKGTYGIIDTSYIVEPDLPTFDFQALPTAKLSSSVLSDGMKLIGGIDAGVFGIGYEDGCIVVSAVGTADEVELREPLVKPPNEKVMTTIDMDFASVIRTLNADDVSVSIGQDKPICIRHGIGEDGVVMLMIAPRFIRDDDDYGD